MSIPNLITLARILSVPILVWAIAAGHFSLAFALFLAAGVSDAVDGFLAKRFGMQSELGAYLDPLADKVLIVSIYVALGIEGHIPRWLVILVVSRDFMIVGAFLLSWVIGKPIAARPHPVSKANTAAQILLAGLVLAALGFGFDAGLGLPLTEALARSGMAVVILLTMAAVATLTLLSVAFYVRDWVRHMGSAETQA